MSKDREYVFLSLMIPKELEVRLNIIHLIIWQMLQMH